ncbi:MAG TPA: hypothetical protein VHU23_18120 [Rhizomicrobium sp.]|nr:hypothetical protein [Rhizomicrobium sp.]
MRTIGIVTAGFAMALIAARVGAESSGPYPLHEMNFDMWCQEQQHLSPERCDKRLPQDDAAFQAYTNKIENYEIPYLQRRQKDQTLNQVIIHNDPVDHPTLPSQPQTDEPPAGGH